MYRALFLGALVCSVLGADFVDADTVSFDFRKRGWSYGREMTFSDPSGLSVSVTGSRTSPYGTREGWVTQTSSGLGVYSGTRYNPWDDPAVDGDYRSFESLSFKFDPGPVTLETVTFTVGCDYRSRDEFTLIVDGREVLADALIPRHDGLYDVSFSLDASDRTGECFEFRTTDRGDDWYLAGMDVTMGGGAGGGSSVPEPSSIALLGLGAGLVGLIRRRRRQQR